MPKSILSDATRKKFDREVSKFRSENRTVKVEPSDPYWRSKRLPTHLRIYRKLLEIERLCKLLEKSGVPSGMVAHLQNAVELLADTLHEETRYNTQTISVGQSRKSVLGRIRVRRSA